MKLTVYGSFNCPYSFLASLRVERLCGLGVADVEWRAVVHYRSSESSQECSIGS